MRDKICMITGANSGIGNATAQGLAALGATVVAVCRDQTRGQKAVDAIKRATGSDKVELMVADLSSQAAVRQLARDYQRQHDQLHVLINNAGVIRSTFTKTADGIETTFAVNQLAPFLLTHLLTPMLKASAPARVVNVFGNAGEIHFDDLMGESGYDGMAAYQQSKRANALFTDALSRRLDGTGVTANAADPGFVRTRLGRDTRGMFRVFLTLMRPFQRSPQHGAEMLIYAASAPELDDVTGKCFTTRQPAPLPLGGYAEADADRLWDICASLTKIEGENTKPEA